VVRLKRKQNPTGEANKFDRMPQEILYTTLESSLQRSAELFRGLDHSELAPKWVLSQMETQIDQASQVIAALQRKVDD
jgi:hypothetical protein